MRDSLHYRHEHRHLLLPLNVTALEAWALQMC